MFGTIRKHSKWLWMVIITLTVISFVVFFSPSSNFNPGPTARFGSIYGKEITEDHLRDAQEEAMLQYFFMSGGRWPDQESRQSYDLERETYQWLMLKRKADEMGVHISTEMVADVARNMIGQFARAGINNAQAFQTQVLQPRGMNLLDMERFVRTYLSIQQLVNLYGMGGKLVTPEEAKALWIRENQALATEAVFFNASNYLSQVNVDTNVLSMFFTNRLAAYRIPERMQVKYVAFPLSNHLAEAEAELAKTNLAEIVESNMQNLGTNYTEFGETPEEAKAEIRQRIIRSRALIEARRKANDFASTLFDMEPVQPENMDKLAQERGLQVSMTEPFTRREDPKGIETGGNLTKVAFNMNLTNDVFGGPVIGEDGIYVLAFGRRVPSEMPDFEQIRDQVTEDFRNEQAEMMARRAGYMFHQAVTNSMAQGKEFGAAAAEAGQKPVTLPPFSIATRSLPDLEHGISVNELKQIAFSLKPGEVSPFIPTAEGGMVLHLREKLPIDDQKLASELPDFVQRVRQSRTSEAFNEWFSKEAAVALRDTPLATPRPAPTMSGAPAKS